MNEMHDDEVLRRRLRSIDPAASLPPLDAHRKAYIMATIRNTQPEQPASSPPADAEDSSSPEWVWLQQLESAS